MTSATDPVSLIEAAYRTELSDQEWLQGIADAVSPALGAPGGVFAASYDATRDDWIDIRGLGWTGMDEETVRGFFSVEGTPPPALVQAYRSLTLATVGEVVKRLPPLDQHYAALMQRLGVDDVPILNAVDASAHGCLLGMPGACIPDSPRSRQLWRRLAAHVATGLRLRRQLASLGAEPSSDPTAKAEAVLGNGGRLEHAVGPAREAAGREALCDGLVRIDRARSSARSEPDLAVELWRGLVAGRWSIVEHFERDGRRYYLAYRNEPQLAPDRRLSRRERQVLAYASRGYSDKLIAYSLGLTASAAKAYLARARRKLGPHAREIAALALNQVGEV